MKKLLTLLLTLLTLPLAAQQLPAPLAAYRAACTAMTTAIDKHDKYALYTVQEQLEAISTTEYEDMLPADTLTSQNSERPLIYFLPEYVDTVIARGFQLAALDDPAIMRRLTDDAVLTRHAAIAPGATLTWKANACDYCALFIASWPAAPLRLTITDLTTGKTYKALPDPSRRTSTVTWQMPAETTDEPNFTITVTNPTTKKVSFVIAMN